MPELKSNGHWTLDRRVPVGIIFAILIQTTAIGVYIGSLDNRVAQIERTLSQGSDQRDRLIVLETQMQGILDTLLRIERRMERDDQAAQRERQPR